MLQCVRQLVCNFVSLPFGGGKVTFSKFIQDSSMKTAACCCWKRKEDGNIKSQNGTVAKNIIKCSTELQDVMTNKYKVCLSHKGSFLLNIMMLTTYIRHAGKQKERKLNWLQPSNTTFLHDDTHTSCQAVKGGLQS